MNQGMNKGLAGRGMGGWSWRSLVRDLSAAWRLLWDPKVPTLIKLTLPLFALIYWISPIDLLPGLPFDDIAVLLAAARIFVMLAPQASVNRAFNGGNAQSGYANSRREDDVVDTTWRVVDDK